MPSNDLTKDEAQVLANMLATPVGPESLRTGVHSRQTEELFSHALAAYNARNFADALEGFRASHESMGLSPNVSSVPLRNTALALYQNKKVTEAFNVLLPWFTGHSLYGAPLWNFAVFAIKCSNYALAIKALEAWKARPVSYLLPKCLLLGAAINRMLERTKDSQIWLSEARKLDPSFVKQRFSTAGIATEASAWTIRLSKESREIVLAQLTALLEPRKPERYPILGKLPLQDFERASKAIDLATDDDFISALAFLKEVPESPNSAAVQDVIEAAIRLQLNEPAVAEELLQKASGIITFPGSVWWNWAVCSATLGDYDSCAQRLNRCVQTEFATNAEAWLCLLLVSLLIGEGETAKTAAMKVWNRSERARLMMASVLRDLDEDLLQQLGITLAIRPDNKQLEVEPSAPSLDVKSLKAALRRSDLQEVLRLLSIDMTDSVRSLPEFSAEPMIPSVSPYVPRVVIQNNLQKLFKKGVEVLSVDPLEAISIFANLSMQLPTEIGVKRHLMAAYFAAGRYYEALEVGRALLNLSSDKTIRIPLIIGVLACLVAEGKFSEAETLLIQEKSELGPRRLYLYLATIAEQHEEPRKLAEAMEQLSVSTDVSKQALLFSARKCAEVADVERCKSIVDILIEKELSGDKAATRKLASECITLNEQRQAFESFASAKDWQRCEEYFEVAKVVNERNYYQGGEKQPIPLLYATAFLAEALVNNRKGQAAECCLRECVDFIRMNREKLDAPTESDLAERLAVNYAVLGSPFRARDTLELAANAARKQFAIQALDNLQLPKLDLELLEIAVSDLKTAVDDLTQRRSPAEVDSCEKAIGELFDIIGQAKKSELDRFSAFMKRALTDSRIKVETARPALADIAELIFVCRLHLPAAESERTTEHLQKLEDLLKEIVEEKSQPPCALVPVEANHDGTSATLVIECRCRARDKTGPIAIVVKSTQLLELTDKQHEFVVIEQTQKKTKNLVARITFDEMLPGQRQRIPLSFGIVGKWSAEQVAAINANLEIADPTDSSKIQNIPLSFSVEFRPFEEPSVTYPNAAIEPEVGGQPLYGREEYVRRLSSSLAHTKQSRLYFLFGPRKIGKTSILNFVAAEVRNQAAGHLCVYVDFERKWTQGSPVTHIVEQILRAAKRAALPLEGFDLPPPQSIGQLEDWLESFKAATKINHFVLMLDEFFTLIKHLKDNDDSGFLGDLRYLWSRVHLVSLVLADWHSVEEMSDCVPAQFWADIDDIDVGFLDEAATRQAMRGPASNSKIEFTDEASNEIYALTRGYSWHVQQICDYAVREAVRDLRCNILKSDIQLAAERLIDEPRTFKQGLFRPDRISPEEEILLWKLCKCTDAYETWVPKSLVNEQEPPLNSINQWKSLVLKSVLQESGGSVRLCSPLVYSWLIRQFEEGKQISSMSLPEGIALPKLKGCLLERDVHTQILRLVTDLINYKRKLKDACRLYTLDSPFKHEDYAEIESLKVLVNSADTWNTFIGALKLLMVDDLRMSVDSLETTPYTILAKILHQVRLRRNYVEHPDNPSKWARIVELQHRKSDITKDDPRLPDDWTRLQIGLLQRTIRALALQLATLEEQHAQAVTA